MATRWEATLAFQEALGELISKHWQDIAPGAAVDDDDISSDTIDEMGAIYPSCWVLVMGISSIENTRAPTLTVRYHPDGQNPFTGIGLLQDCISSWVG